MRPDRARRASGPARLATVLLSVVAVLALAAGCRPRPWHHGHGHHGHASLHDDARTHDAPVAPLSTTGRWLTDATGRVVTLHGVNEVAKAPPYYPAAFGIGDDDAAFLDDHGFDVVRLGVAFEGLMPEPGVVATDYVEHLAETVETFTDHGIFVVVDFHQDGFSPMFNGNGLPDWMAITDGLPNPPDAVFPLYYVQNPAMQRAFEHFWANDPGPDGVGIQDAYLRGVRAVVERFAGNRHVLGYEPMNEPWPGADWTACASAAGCPDQERELLQPFYGRVADIVGSLDRHQLVLGEPFVLFDFGQSPTTSPGIGARGAALSFHSYAAPEAEAAVVAHALDAADAQGVPALATEFGATTDPAALDRLADGFDEALVSWLDWAYNESILLDPSRPAGLDNVRSLEAFRALVRPHAVVVAGTPTAASFDGDTGDYRLSYSTRGPRGQRFDRHLATSVEVPSLRYPDGYTVEVDGAEVTSDACSSTLTLRSDPRAGSVSLHLTPGAGCWNGGS